MTRMHAMSLGLAALAIVCAGLVVLAVGTYGVQRETLRTLRALQTRLDAHEQRLDQQSYLLCLNGNTWAQVLARAEWQYAERLDKLLTPCHPPPHP